jgi:hypothetical protein
VWPEGPVCDPCYTAALRTRATCDGCGEQRRLVAPAGPDATTCSDCAGLPATHVCSDCGIEDKLYERGRCDRCALHRRVTDLLADDHGDIPTILLPIAEAIRNAPVARSALNWLRGSASAELLADLAAGRLALTHAASTTTPTIAPPPTCGGSSPPTTSSTTATRTSPASSDGPPASSTASTAPATGGSCTPTPPGTSPTGCAAEPPATRDRARRPGAPASRSAPQ